MQRAASNHVTSNQSGVSWLSAQSIREAYRHVMTFPSDRRCPSAGTGFNWSSSETFRIVRSSDWQRADSCRVSAVEEGTA